MRPLALILLFFLTAPALADTGPSYRVGVDHFRFRYEVKVPDLAKGQTARVWLPLGQSNRFQKVQRTIDAAGLHYITTKTKDFNDEVAVVDATAADSGKTFTVSYLVNRREKSAYVASPADEHSELYRRSETLVPVTPRFRKMAEEAIGGKKDDLARGRALYDFVLHYMRYDKSGVGWGRGDATYACDVKTGNCTDFHSLFIALARSVGIPARFAVGFSIPAATDGGRVEGYHCWAEFLAHGRWVPVDISEAWRNPAAAQYYFGHHPANRFELTAGRDLVLKPLPASGAINFLVHPLLEIDGHVAKKFVGTYSFERLPTPRPKS